MYRLAYGPGFGERYAIVACGRYFESLLVFAISISIRSLRARSPHTVGELAWSSVTSWRRGHDSRTRPRAWAEASLYLCHVSVLLPLLSATLLRNGAEVWWRGCRAAARGRLRPASWLSNRVGLYARRLKPSLFGRTRRSNCCISTIIIVIGVVVVCRRVNSSPWTDLAIKRSASARDRRTLHNAHKP